MERLTMLDGMGNAELRACMECHKPGFDNENCGRCEKPYAAYDKLAAYEDAEEQGRVVKRGMWKSDNSDVHFSRLTCSSCKKSMFAPYTGEAAMPWLYCYCPNCGAKMDLAL